MTVKLAGGLFFSYTDTIYFIPGYRVCECPLILFPMIAVNLNHSLTVATQDKN